MPPRALQTKVEKNINKLIFGRNMMAQAGIYNSDV